MNVSKLTLADQCKAFSDAAEFNRQKASTLAMLDQHAYDQSPKAKQYRKTVIQKHLRDAELYATECRRLQTSLNAQRK